MGARIPFRVRRLARRLADGESAVIISFSPSWWWSTELAPWEDVVLLVGRRGKHLATIQQVPNRPYFLGRGSAADVSFCTSRGEAWVLRASDVPKEGRTVIWLRLPWRMFLLGIVGRTALRVERWHVDDVGAWTLSVIS